MEQPIQPQPEDFKHNPLSGEGVTADWGAVAPETFKSAGEAVQSMRQTDEETFAEFDDTREKPDMDRNNRPVYRKSVLMPLEEVVFQHQPEETPDKRFLVKHIKGEVVIASLALSAGAIIVAIKRIHNRKRPQ